MDNNIHIESLGARLKEERLRKNDTQKMFAARIGVSVPTLKKMEDGNLSVQIGSWVTALRMLDRESDLDLLLASPQDIFEKFNQEQMPKRQRASRNKR